MKNRPLRALDFDSEWTALSTADTEALVKYGKEAAKDAKTVLFEQGEQAKKLYLLTTGIIRVSRLLPDGERHIIAFHWPGDLFGLEENGLYLDHAEAVTPCVVHELPANRLHEFLLSHPQVQQAILIKAVQSLRAAQRQLIVVGRLDVHRAMAAFLLDCSAHEKYFDITTKTLSLPMSRYDIADYLGTATESITRAMARLEDEKLIQRTTPRDIVLNLSGLRKLANLD